VTLSCLEGRGTIKDCNRRDSVAATVNEDDAEHGTTENKVVVAVCARLRRSLIGEADVT